MSPEIPTWAWLYCHTFWPGGLSHVPSPWRDGIETGGLSVLTPQSSRSLGTNLNGPSLIRAPDWLERPLGRDYLYFAHHRGTFIRLAYADRLTGPWNVYESGTLKRSEAPSCSDHVASPDVHVDDARKEIRMYFHCPTSSPGSGPQRTFLAVSKDGLPRVREAGHLVERGRRAGPTGHTSQPWRGAHLASRRSRGIPAKSG
jgi:hypothetical protein